MKELLTLSLPGYPSITLPENIPHGTGTTNSVFNFGIELLIITGITASLIYLILGGIRWITSGGDKEKIEGARKGITYSIIGLVVILLSFVIINIIGQIFGIGNLQMFGIVRNETRHIETPEIPTPTARPHNPNR